MPPRFEILIPTIPHRHARLLALLAHLDLQMQASVRVIVWQDNLQVSYGDKQQGLLDASRADYVAFLDDDDWVAGDYVPQIMSALELEPDYVGFRQLYTVDGVDQGFSYHSLTDRTHGQFPAAVRGDIVHKNPLRRELALLGHWRGGYGADGRWAAEVRASGRVQTEVYIDEPMYFYRYRTEDRFQTLRQPWRGPLPVIPTYDWLREL